MMDLELPLRGVLAGLIIAAPVGPVNVLCIQRTIEKGWRSGLVSGFGAAAADTIYGSIAGFGVSLVIDWLIREQFWIRLIGGFVLLAIGVWYYFRSPQSLEEARQKSTDSDFTSTFLLTLTNPTTVLSFIAVLAVLGMSQRRPWWMTVFLVAGIFTGSMTWWLLLTGMVNRLRARITDRTMVWLNRAAGIAIGAFGVLNFILSKGHKH
jgi:threonine/homoserine/homoserine lactone efflux protein